MSKPLITALIDTYNQERYVEQAVASVLDQGLSASELEIVIVDDGSTDRTSSILQKFVPRVKYLRKENGGQASALNTALREVHGPIVAFLDGDDWWAKGKLRAVLDCFENNDGIAAVGHGYFEVFGDAPPCEMFVATSTCFLDLSSTQAAQVASLGRTLLGTSRLAVRREILERIGELPSQLIFCADTPILTLSLALGGAIVLERPLCFYRYHSENLFARGAADAQKLRRTSDTLAFLLEYLPKRLSEFGVPEDRITSLLEPDRLELARLELLFAASGRWKSFQTEVRDFKSAYRNVSPGYFLFKAFVGAMALALPVRRFYQLRGWYARNNLGRVRNSFAKANPAVSPAPFQRLPVPARD
jgi:glycosyltransferase involved in cell wall biosynthesis